MSKGNSYIENRNELLEQMKTQRQAAILKRLSGTMNPVEKIKQNDMSSATAKLVTILTGAGIGAGVVGHRNKWTGGSIAGGALLGALAGAIAASTARIGGRIAGDITNTDHRRAMKDYADVGLARYLIPGISEYHDSKLENALIDTEKGVKRPEQVVI